MTMRADRYNGGGGSKYQAGHLLLTNCGRRQLP